MYLSPAILVQYFNPGLDHGPFDYQKEDNYLNTGLVGHSDTYCISLYQCVKDGRKKTNKEIDPNMSKHISLIRKLP